MIRKAIVLGVAFSLLAFVGVARGQRITGVNVSARLIQAKKEGPEKVDPALADIEKKLKSTPFKYKQYELVSKQGGFISVGKTLKGKFPKNMVLESTMLGGADGQVQMNLRWTLRKPKERPLEYFNTRVRISQGETFVMAGPKSNGGVLLLAVTVQ